MASRREPTSTGTCQPLAFERVLSGRAAVVATDGIAARGSSQL